MLSWSVKGICKCCPRLISLPKALRQAFGSVLLEASSVDAGLSSCGGVRRSNRAGSSLASRPTGDLRGHLLQLDDVAFGIPHVDRLAGSARAIAVNRFAHNFDPALAQIDCGRVQIARVHPEAEVVYVEAFLGAPALGRNQIDHAAAGPKLDQTELRNAPFLGKSENARVEIERPLQIATAENYVIKLGDFKRPIHREIPRGSRAAPGEAET